MLYGWMEGWKKGHHGMKVKNWEKKYNFELTVRLDEFEYQIMSWFWFIA